MLHTTTLAFLVCKLIQPVASFIHPYTLLISRRNLFNKFFNTVDHKILAVEKFGG